MVLKVFVTLTRDGVLGWVFKLVCPGYAMSISHERLLLLKNATVNRNLGFNAVCNEKHVNIAYWDNDPDFEVTMASNSTTDKMTEWKPILVIGYGEYISWMWEVQAAFFKQNNIQPHWFNASIPDRFNETTGYTGYLGMIERDEVDYAVVPSVNTAERNNYFAPSAPYQFAPDYFFTRYPLELSPLWNLTGLFTKAQEFTNKLDLAFDNVKLKNSVVKN